MSKDIICTALHLIMPYVPMFVAAGVVASAMTLLYKTRRAYDRLFYASVAVTACGAFLYVLLSIEWQLTGFGSLIGEDADLRWNFQETLDYISTLLLFALLWRELSRRIANENALFDLPQSGFVVLQDKKVVFANDDMAAILDTTSGEELIGMNFSEILCMTDAHCTLDLDRIIKSASLRCRLRKKQKVCTVTIKTKKCNTKTLDIAMSTDFRYRYAPAIAMTVVEVDDTVHKLKEGVVTQ